jgi:hypothetical protein
MIGKGGGCVLYSPKYGNYLIKTDIMSMKLLSPSQDFSSQAAEEVQIVENLQQEIDCPRCMTLSSDFDGLLYFCQECQLSLVMK